jgi:4-carboxymuconolactone decarboxylase
VTAFRRRSYLDFLYGEVWQRQMHLSRRDKRIVTICCAASVGVDEEVVAHLRAALSQDELTYQELQELVVHYAVYLGWHLGARLDDLLLQVARELEIEVS